MLTWGYYRFKMRLMNKTRQDPDCHAVICSKYTSKACSECRYSHNKLAAAKTFKCPKFKQEPDRDFNTAITILLKNMSFYSVMHD